jgi:hypothetical protein
MFRAQAHTASDGHRASVRRWQGRDRFYRQVQRAAAQVVGASEEAQAVMEDLIALARPLPRAGRGTERDLTHGLLRACWSIVGQELGLLFQLTLVAVGLGAIVAKSRVPSWRSWSA